MSLGTRTRAATVMAHVSLSRQAGFRDVDCEATFLRLFDEFRAQVIP
jgi:hypothetical protein